MWSEQWGLTDCTYADYLVAALRHGTTPNGIFGAKMMWSEYFDVFLGKVRSIPSLNEPNTAVLLSRIFPDLRYLWLSRRDKVRQGISHWKALQTGVWGVTRDTGGRSQKEAVYNFDAIHHLVSGAAKSDAAWARYFAHHGIRPYVVTYEDFTVEHEATIARVLTFLGIPRPSSLGIEKTQLQKQADATSEAWLRRYLTEAIVKDTPV